MNTIKVQQLPDCDICQRRTAKYDAPLAKAGGSWANVCPACAATMQADLTIGSRLVVQEEKKSGRRLSIQELLHQQGLEDSADLDDFLADCAIDSVISALCSAGCQVEPDGTCPHGNPSVLLAMGLI